MKSLSQYFFQRVKTMKTGQRFHPDIFGQFNMQALINRLLKVWGNISSTDETQRRYSYVLFVGTV